MPVLNYQQQRTVGLLRRRQTQRFEQLIASMDLPEQRKYGSPNNAVWFIRHGGIRNRDHNHFDEAYMLARFMC
ncbi:MAG: hypothetical protein OEZ58_01510 [Gammaproteobacteria bacterium]|nr:hypothetical protein [Gammaproteobacteria bacterium]MDH5727647.1 hypothetical protein [Gammaproteobacteria bacterium]